MMLCSLKLQAYFLVHWIVLFDLHTSKTSRQSFESAAFLVVGVACASIQFTRILPTKIFRNSVWNWKIMNTVTRTLCVAYLCFWRKFCTYMITTKCTFVSMFKHTLLSFTNMFQSLVWLKHVGHADDGNRSDQNM